MNTKWSIALASALILVSSPSAFSRHHDKDKDKNQAKEEVKNQPKVWMAEQVEGDDPLGMAEASTKKKKHRHRVIRGLGKELKKSGEYFAKDLAMFLSVQDIDLYEKKSVPLDKPCTVLTFQYTDGQRARLVRYPDRSFRVFGSIFEGTVMIPDGPKTFIIKYPNGAKGKVVSVNSSLIKSYRPDGTVTTLQKQMSGQYSIRNSKQGYLGMARSDRTGITWED